MPLKMPPKEPHKRWAPPLQVAPDRGRRRNADRARRGRLQTRTIHILRPTTTTTTTTTTTNDNHDDTNDKTSTTNNNDSNNNDNNSSNNDV